MENKSLGEAIEGPGKRYKHPKYLPRHLEPSGAWEPIRIGNVGAAFRAGKGCTAGKRYFKLEPLEKDAAGGSDTSAGASGSDSRQK